MEHNVVVGNRRKVGFPLLDIFMPYGLYGHIVKVLGPNRRESHKIFEIMNPASSYNYIVAVEIELFEENRE